MLFSHFLVALSFQVWIMRFYRLLFHADNFYNTFQPGIEVRNIKQYWVGSYRNAILLILIIIVGGISKITLFFMVQADDPSRIFSPDSASYVNTARAFLKTGRFAISPDRPDIPQVVRTPGYPFFIASIFFFFGEKYPALIIVQILVSLGTIVVTYFIALKLWDHHIAVLSAFLLALDLPSFINSLQVLTETLFTFVVSLTVFAGLCMLKDSRHIALWALLYGILLSLATLIRPVAYNVIFLVSITMLVILLRTYGSV